MEKQRPAQEAYQEIIESFYKTEDGNIIYPDDFGGAYYKDGYLYINSNDLVGTSVCKYGSIKGFAVARIDKVNTVVYYGSVAIYDMSKATFTSGSGQKGDSGSPVYFGHVLYGIHSGDNAIENGADAIFFWYSPIYGVPSSFVVKTN